MIEIKIIDHVGNEEEIIELFKSSFNKEMPLKFWRWKHLENPLNPPDPKIAVAVDKERIIGARPLMLTNFRIGKHVLRAVQGADVMVHPDYRRRGIYSRMHMLAMNYFQDQKIGFIYGFPNFMALPGNLKQGFQEVLQIELLLYVNKASSILIEKLGNPLLGKVLGFSYDILLKKTYKLDEKINQKYSVNIYDSFPEKLREIDTLYDTERIELLRSEKYLKWRFDQHPVNNYSYVLVEKEEELLGYAVICTFKFENSLELGQIVDCIVKNNDLECFRVLMTHSLEELKKRDCDAILFGENCIPDFREILISEFGFKSTLSFPYSHFIKSESVLIALELNKTLNEQIDIFDRSNWKLTSLYRDTT